MNSTKNAAGVISRLSYSEDSAVIALYQKQLEGLTLTQQKLAMSTAGLSAEQQKFILSKIQEASVVGKATTASLLELSTKNQEILQGAGIVLSNEAESSSEVVLTKAIYDKIIVATADNEVARQQILNSFGVTDANIKQAGSYGLLTGSVKAFGASLKAAWANGGMKGLWNALPKMGKIGIIAAMIVAVNKLAGLFYDTTEEIQQKIEDAKNKISETESEISDLDNQINETTDLINKMKEAGASEDAISTYEKENQLLRDQKKILEDIIKDEKTVIANESARLINNEGSSSRLDGMLGALQNFDIMGSSKQTPIVGGLLGMFSKDGNGLERDGYIEDFEKGGFWNGMKNIALDLFAPTVSTFTPFEDPADDIVLQSNRLIEKYSNTKESYSNAKGDEREEYREELAGITKVLNGYIPQLIESRNAMSKDNVDGIYDDEIAKIDDVLANYYKARPDIGFEITFKGGDETSSEIGDVLFTELANGGNADSLKKIISEKITKDGDIFKNLVEHGIIDENDTNWVQTIADKFIEYYHSGNMAPDEWVNNSTKNIDKMTVSMESLKESFEAVETAISEYNKTGYLSVETFEKLMALEPKYLNMLIDENGNLNLNTEAVQANTAAYIENMGVKAAQNLIDTVSGMKGTAEQLEYLTGITNENTEATWANIYTQLAQADAVSDPAVMDALYSRINTIKAMTDATLAGISKGGLSGKSKAEDTAKKRREQQEKQYNADLQYRIDKITQSLEKYTKRLEQLKEAQDDLYEDDYIGKIDYINQRYEVQSQYTEETKKELDSLLETIPQTAEGWNKLASAVENVSEKYFESKRALIDYQVELSEAYMDALKMVSETPKSALDDSINQYSRNVKMLTEGGLGGLKFRLTPIVPEDAVAKQRKENEELAKEEEAYQEKVNQIKKRALDEMKAYEDAERARQLADLTSEASEAMDSLNEDFWKAMNMGWSDFKELIETEGIDVNINWSGIGSESDAKAKEFWAEQNGVTIVKNPKRGKNDTGTGWQYKTADGKTFETVEGASAHNKDLIVQGNKNAIGTRTQLGKDLGLTVKKAKDGTNEYSIKFKDGNTETYDSLQDVKDSLANVDNNSDPALKKLYCNYYGVVIDKTDPDDWKYIFAGQTKENIEEIRPLVEKRLSAVSTKAKGGTATGDIIVNEEGQESYLGKDGKLHLFKPGAQFFNTDEVVRVFNAEDTKKIRKYTGDKYFNEPIGDLSKVTQLANGNIKAVFPAVTPENTNNNEDIAQLSEKATEEHYDRMGDIQNKALNEEIAMDAEAQAITEVQKEQHYDKMEIAQQITNDITSQEQIADNAEKVTEEKRFSTETEGVVTELLNWMKNNPIKAPGLDTASWKQMISDAQGYMSQLMGGFGNIAYNPETGNKVLDMAASFNGRPYVYGGGHSNGFSGGLDCSGYVSAVLSALGYKVVSDANGFKNVGSKVPISEMQPGDILIFDYKHDGTADHVGFYAGNNQMWHSSGDERNTANNPGRGVHLSNLSSYYKNALVQVNRVPLYASGTKDYGVAGENYKKEFLIDKKTGQWTEVNSPTLIDTNEVNVVGEKASAKIDKPLPMYANGTLGTMDMSSEMPKLTTEQIQKILSTNFANSKLNVAGAAEGIFNAQQSTGVSALAMLAIAAGESGWGTSKLSNAKNNYWGWNHYSANGKSAFDRATTFSSNPGEAFTAYGEKLKSAGYSEQSLAEMADKYCPDGKWYGLVSGTMSTIVNTLNDAGLGDMSANIATTASNTTSIRRSFDQQIKDFLSGSWNSESSETYEDVLMNVIREGVKTSDAYTQEYLEGFNSLITSQDNYETGYKERYEKLLAAKGTPEFDEIKNDLTEYTRNHVEDVLSASTKMNTAYAKSQYDIISQMYDAAIAHYNKRLSEGASADELKVYADSINVLQDQKNDLSDNYVQAIQDETNQITSVIDRDFRKFDDELSWYDEDESDTGKRYENISKRNEINQRKESSAKEGFAELLNDPKFAKIIELNGGNIEDWFDRDGNISATFEEFMSTHAASELSSDDMAYAKQLVTIGSAYKKEMVEASDAVKDSAEAMADLKIKEYIKYQERLVESLEFDATLSQSLSTAKEGMYSLFKTLRDEKAEMEKELKANMQIDDWLTEDTRRQLFNLDDYEEQMGVINEIEAEAQSLYAEYQNDLANLKEDELYKEEEITAEYNRQLESLQDKLSIAKADLQLAKDKAAFENALKERDTQIIMGNRVQNVADPERLREAAMKVAESESALENEKTTSAENQDIRNMEATTGMINQEKGAIQNRIDMINGMTEEERRVFADFLEPLQVYRNRILALTKTNPYRIITGDNSNDVFMSRDYSKIEGYSLTQDHSSAVDEIQHLLDNGYYKQGTPEYDVALKTIDILKKQHDDKTTSDAHNYGYDLYDPANSVNWYRYMKMYTDLGYAIQSQERPSVDETMLEAYEDAANNLPVISGEGEILVSANKKPHSSTTFSGDGDISLADGENVGINEFNDYISQLEKEWEENTISITPYSGLFEDYKEVSLAEMISPLLDDSSMAESIAQSIVSGAIAPNIDTIASVFSRAQALDLIKNGNNDNSIHMQNVNVTLEKPVADPNDFIQQLISKVNSEYSTTNNQR